MRVSTTEDPPASKRGKNLATYWRGKLCAGPRAFVFYARRCPIGKARHVFPILDDITLTRAGGNSNRPKSNISAARCVRVVARES